MTLKLKTSLMQEKQDWAKTKPLNLQKLPKKFTASEGKRLRIL